MALAEKRICEHTDATTISSADEFIVDSMANGTRNITMTNLESQILSTDTYSALTGIGDGTITGSIVDIDSNLNNLTYDSTTNRLTMTGNTAFSGTIDSSPTAGSGNAVSSGGTKTYVDSAVSQLNAEIGDNHGTLTQRINLSASGNSSYTVTSDSAVMVVQFEGYLAAASDVYEANVQVNGLMIGYLGCREGVACSPTKREQIRIPFRVFKNDVIKITLSLVGSAVGYATLYTT